MEIIIIKCPHCDEPVAYRILSNNFNEQIEKRTNDDKLNCFNLIKKSSKEAYENNKFFEQIFNDMTDLKNYKPKAEVSLGNYFLALKEKLKTTKNPEDLHKLRKEIIKSRIIVKKPLKKEFEEQKRKMIEEIDKRVGKSGKRKNKKLGKI